MAGWGPGDGGGGSGGGGGKSPGQKRAETAQQSKGYPKKQLIRLATRLNRVDPSDPHHGEIMDALGEQLRGYDAGEILKIGQSASLSHPDLVKLRQFASKESLRSAPASGPIPAALDYLSRPGQAVVSGIAGYGDPGDPFGTHRAMEGLLGRDRTSPVQAAVEAFGGKSPQDAQKVEKDLPGPVRFAGNTAGSIVTDPLTYVTFGAGPGSSAAVRTAAPAIAARRAGVEVGELAAVGAERSAQELAEDMTRRGLKALTREERKELPRAVLRGVRRAPGGMRVAGHAVPGTVRVNELFRSVGRGVTRAGLEDVPVARAATSLEVLARPRGGAHQLARVGEAPGLAEDLENLSARFKGRSRTGQEIGVARARRAVEGPSRFRVFHPDRVSSDGLARVREALEDPEKFAALEGSERAAAEALDAMRRDVDRMRVGESGILRSAEQLEAQGIDALPLEQRFPRFLSDASQKLQRRGQLPDVGRPDVGGLASQRLGRLEETKFSPTEEIALPSGLPRFELHPGKAMARDYAAASQDAARVQFVDELAKVTDQAGVPFVRLDATDAERASGAWVEKHLPVRNATEDGLTRTRPVLVRKEIAADFDRLVKVASDDAARVQWGRYLDKFMGLWKAYATSPLPFGLGFMIRNFEGNLVNGFLLGNTNPLHLFAAHRLRDAMLQGIREAGDPLLHVAAKQRALLQDALDHGVLSTGFFSNLEDLGRLPEVAGRGGIRRAGRALNKVNPLSQEAVWLRGGRAMNEAVEDVSRLGMFMGQRAKGLSPAESARMVRTYLFDYSDASTILRGARHVAPFATWAYKNTPLQLAALLRTPGKIAAQRHVLDALRGESGPVNSEDVPQWMLDEEGVVLPGGAGDVFPGDTGDDALVWVPDLPLTSAMQNVDPLVKLAALAQGKPGALRDFARSASSASGVGGLAGVALALQQVAAGRDVFTQRPFYPGERVQTPSYLAPLVETGVVPDTIPRELQYLLESALPGATKVRGALPTEPGDEAKQTRRLLSFLTGQNIQRIDRSASRSESFRRLNELDELRRSLEAQGVKVPDSRARSKATAGEWG